LEKLAKCRKFIETKAINMMRITILLLLVGFFTRCATYTPTMEPPADEIITQSLFNSDKSNISEENIQKLLSSRIIKPDSARIAVFDYTSFSKKNNAMYDYYYWTDEDNLKIQQGYIDTLSRALKKSEKVKKVMLIPSMLVNKAPTIIELREITVRLQADYLLVYTFNSDVYYDYKAFDKNEIKAFATCEAILLDTRTGLIPYSTIVTKDVLIKKEKEDIDNDMFRKRAINCAVDKALKSVGNDVAIFLHE